MDENEEFEFRIRAEQEASAKSPSWMQEAGLEPVGLAESFLGPVKGYAAALPAIEATRRFAGPTISKIAGQMLPKTGGELLGGAATAGAGGVAGELAARKAPPEYKGAARTAAEILMPSLGAATGRLGRGATPAIPKERIESARYMKERGAMPSPEQVRLGPESRATRGRLETQQGAVNQVYNESVGLPSNKAFGKQEFQKAQRQASTDYDRLLSGRKVYFDEPFFNNLEQVLGQQQQLAASGISFGQSRAIIGALERIGNIPKNLKAKIDSLPRIGEEEATAEQSQQALSVLNELLPTLRQQGRIEMDAKAYNEIRSILGDAAARATINRNARVLRQMQGAFDEAANKSMPDIVRDLEGVRRRYEALKTLEEAQLQSGVETGVIPAEAVGKAIRNRIEQGAIYGNNNPLRQVGESGIGLGIVAPSTGRGFAKEVGRVPSPTSSLYGALRDVVGMGVYPMRAYGAGRRISEVPSAGQAIPQIAAPTIGREVKDATQER